MGALQDNLVLSIELIKPNYLIRKASLLPVNAIFKTDRFADPSQLKSFFCCLATYTFPGIRLKCGVLNSYSNRDITQTFCCPLSIARDFDF